MKIIKFFSFSMLLSIAFVACKDNSKTEQTAENTAESIETAMQTAKAELAKNVSELQATISVKITEAETEFGTASEEAKGDINKKLDVLRKQRTDLEQLTAKVSQATAENWAQLQADATKMVADIKEALNK
jgi:hypothetical protein